MAPFGFQGESLTGGDGGDNFVAVNIAASRHFQLVCHNSCNLQVDSLVCIAKAQHLHVACGI